MARILISGRFGNQLFLWAKAHEILLNDDKVTLYHDKRVPIEELESLLALSKFCNHQIEIRRAKWPFLFFRVAEKVFLKFPESWASHVLRKFFFQADIDPDSWSIGPLIFLIKGYFQAYRTFELVKEQILPELYSLIETRNRSIQSNVLDDLNDVETLNVCHIRRGDYLQAPNHWGILGKQYYTNSLIKVKEIICLTENLEDLSDILPVEKVSRSFSKNQLSEIDSFSIMCRADFLVIANSSFSLWAGYISLERGSKVIAPFPWFNSNYSWSPQIYHPAMKQIPSGFQSTT
jgi:hypothetical protein